MNFPAILESSWKIYRKSDMMNFKDLIFENRIEIGLIGLTLFLMWSYGLLSYPILTDPGLYSYMGQELLRGNVPYRDVVGAKGPMHIFSLSFFMLIFSFLPNYLAIRVGFLILSIIFTISFFLILRKLFNQRVALFSSLVLLSFTYFLISFIIGSAKALSLFFFIPSFTFLLRKRYFLSGLFVSLSYLTWQVGALFITAPLFLILLSEYGWKRKIVNFGKVFIGFLTPLTVFSIYFYLHNSLIKFINVISPFNQPSLKTSFIGNSKTLLMSVFGYYGTEILLFIGGLLGLCIIVKKVFNNPHLIKRKKYISSFFVPFLIYALFLLYDCDGGLDLIFFIPLISILFGFLFKKILDWIQKSLLFTNKWRKLISSILITIILIYGFLQAFQPVYPENPVTSKVKTIKNQNLGEIVSILNEEFGTVKTIYFVLFRRKGERTTLQEQLKLAGIIKNETDEDDKILSLSTPQILVLSERRNANAYPSTLKSYIERINESIGLEKFRNGTISAEPKFIIMKNEEHVEWLGINEWVENNYKELPEDKFSSEEYIVFKRKDLVK